MQVPDIIKQAARDLRTNMTPAEQYLWKYIKSKKIAGKSFQKQKPIFMFHENNNFPRYIIADFICIELKLIIEIDGNIHNISEVLDLDIYKQEMLESRDYRVLRFTNEDVLNNISGVIADIENSVG